MDYRHSTAELGVFGPPMFGSSATTSPHVFLHCFALQGSKNTQTSAGTQKVCFSICNNDQNAGM